MRWLRAIWSEGTNALFVIGAAIFLVAFFYSIDLAALGKASWFLCLLCFVLFGLCFNRTKWIAPRVRRIKDLAAKHDPTIVPQDPPLQRLAEIEADWLSKWSPRVAVALMLLPLVAAGAVALVAGLVLVFAPHTYSQYEPRMDAFFAASEAISGTSIAIGFLLMLVPLVRMFLFALFLHRSQ
jgi:hypothetical protein